MIIVAEADLAEKKLYGNPPISWVAVNESFQCGITKFGWSCRAQGEWDLHVESGIYWITVQGVSSDFCAKFGNITAHGVLS